MAAVGGAPVGEGEHGALLNEPTLHLRFQHGFASRRAVALAVDDANAAQAGAHGVAKKGAEALTRLVAAQAVQVELGLQHPDAAAELAYDVDADAAAAKRERVVGVEQRLGIEFVGDR